MRFPCVTTLVLLAVGVCSSSAGDSTQQKPAWQAELNVPDYPKQNGLRPFIRPAVTFLDPAAVAVAYAIAAPKDSPFPWELSLSILSVTDGSVQVRKTFPMAGKSAGLFRSRAGKLIVWLGGRLIVLSPQTFSTERSRELRGGVGPYTDGEHVVVVDWRGYTVKTGPHSGYVHDSTYKVSFVRLDTLETEAACDVDGLDIPKAVQGDFVANMVTAADGRHGVYLGSFCGVWKRVSDLQGRADFLSPDSLVVTDRPDMERPRVTVITKEGKEVCAVDLKKYSGSLEPAKPSSEGRRFALKIHDLAGFEKSSWDIYRHLSRTHISVYGPASNSCLTVLLDADTTKRPKPPFDFALSPDGGSLVVLGDGRVRMFRVP